MGGRLAGRAHGWWRGVLLAFAVFLILGAADAARAARPLTLDEQAHINVLRKFRPDFADRLVRRLEKLEEELEKRPDLTEEQKNEARQTVIDKQMEAAREALKTAESLGTVQQRKDAQLAYFVIVSFRPVYLKQPAEHFPPEVGPVFS